MTTDDRMNGRWTSSLALFVRGAARGRRGTDNFQDQLRVPLPRKAT